MECGWLVCGCIYGELDCFGGRTLEGVWKGALVDDWDFLPPLDIAGVSPLCYTCS